VSVAPNAQDLVVINLTDHPQGCQGHCTKMNKKIHLLQPCGVLQPYHYKNPINHLNGYHVQQLQPSVHEKN
jgi:hypothetical protein